jgi:hypothetical protein
MMVSPIDAIRYGAGFDETGRWHEANVRFVPAKPKYGEGDPVAASRGLLVGLFVSGVMWVGLFMAGSAVFRLF